LRHSGKAKQAPRRDEPRHEAHDVVDCIKKGFHCNILEGF